MIATINTKDLAKMVKTKRTIDQDIPLHEAADSLGISTMTLSRIENGTMPDLRTYAKLCKWIGVELDKFVKVK